MQTREVSSRTIFTNGSKGGCPLLKDSTTRHPKSPSLVLFYDIHFWPIDPKIFLKAHLAPVYSDLEGKARSNKCDFFKKFPKTAFLPSFFSKVKATQKTEWVKGNFVFRRVFYIQLGFQYNFEKSDRVN